MTLQEENEKLREKINAYEGMLSKVMEGPFTEDEVQSDYHGGMYRLASGVILPVNPNDSALRSLKVGVKIMRNEHMILYALPDELKVKPKPVDFHLIDWGEIGGLKSQIQEIRDSIELPMKQANLYRKFGITPSKGIVLYGPPGCGKTMVAKAIASQFLDGQKLTKDSFIYLKGGEMLSPYVGVAENNIKGIFDRARNNHKKNHTRTVIFIDEAEAILPARGSRRSSDVDSTIVPTFLSEMDGFEENSTLIILATNFIDQLDPAAVRPGRIDLHIRINRPTREDLEDIFKIYLRRSYLRDKLDDLAKFGAEKLSGLPDQMINGAQVKNIVDKASLLALKRSISKGSNTGVQLEDLLTVFKHL